LLILRTDTEGKMDYSRRWRSWKSWEENQVHKMNCDEKEKSGW